MKHYLFFTQDGYLLPSSVKPTYGNDGHYYAVITRECFDCGGEGEIANAVCVACNGSKTSPATKEKLVQKESIEFLETIPELRCNPDLEAWKRRHSEHLALLQADNSKFAVSISQQLNSNLFLTVRQLTSFYSTYQPVSKDLPENAGFPIEHSFNIGDVVNIDIIFTEVRAAFSKGSRSYFFTFTGKKQNDGFALTGNVQNHVLLGHRYHLSGKVRKIHYFDSVPYALLTVFKLTALPSV
ncbi:TPA: hypothetical protein HIT98_003966 [Escherichia coli]|uniref:hypothetical protein n=1 Tax=Escherichia TaxID=561 RepID=UPI000CF75687|nr:MULTISPECIES: hypothetical protein [unclassified Escherichia]EES2025365.1 hypothetical protein [Escherichia coli]EFB2841838.1 hypothetical protein [Escherichia coli]EIY6704510.1 hypothetical protein [Escherichia coli]MBB2342387.1 hypothetical protein [Escherichia sp. 93.0750]MCF7291771.1 hypothetical protein [Escherichia coli]